MEVATKLNIKQRKATRLLTGIFGVIGFLLVRHNIKVSLAFGVIITLMLRSPTIVYAISTTVGRDSVAFYRFVKLNIFLKYLERKGWTVARVFQQRAREHPHKPCFVMEDRQLTFQEVESFTTKVGAYFKSRGLQRGDCVALLMETSPEYGGVWLGLSKVGVITALINSHLRRQTLLHCIKVAKAKAIIVGTELAAALEDVLQDEEVKQLTIYQYSNEAQRADAGFTLLKGAIDLSAELQKQEVVNLSADISACSPKDKLLYVYTSGTTGMPKAAVIKNSRFIFMASATHHMLLFQPDDIIYCPLPLYHTAGGIVGLGNALIHGNTLVLRKKFSATNFWKDCIKYNCTIAQYIGELCRYLLSTPPKPEDSQHKLRLIYGNGLRPQIWSQFVSRFNIPHVGEVYGSTEGNSNLANITNHVGAVGFIPLMGRSIYPVQVIKCDEETGEPLRNAKGLCISCQIGETGLLTGKVDLRHAVTAYNGYVDKEASDKKLLRSVLRKGDTFFNSGDMVTCDFLGYIYFKDRTGDTYRWRGENVATLEVEAIITNVIGLQDCVVYGVDIPHVEGKAGMAAIGDPDRKVDLEHLSVGIRGSLPPYAQPLFIRLMDYIPRTATYKFQKRDLTLEAYNIHKIKDPIYYLNKDGVYRPLTVEQYDNLLNGKAGL